MPPYNSVKKQFCKVMFSGFQLPAVKLFIYHYFSTYFVLNFLVRHAVLFSRTWRLKDMCYSPSIPNFDIHYIDQVSISLKYPVNLT